MELYRYVTPPRKNTPVSVQPLPVDYSFPTEEKIEWAFKRLRNNRSGGPSGMRTEHLKQWPTKAQKDANDRKMAAGKEEALTTMEKGRMGMSEAQKGTESESENWTRVVDLVQSVFREGNLAEEATWQAVVLIPKGKKDYRGIGLVEVLWKVVAAILNR